MTKLHTYLNFAGNAREAFDFYRSVFGGELSALRFKDFPIEGVSVPEADGDKILHTALQIGDDSVLMASDVLESTGGRVVQGNNSYVFAQASTREEADRIFGALSEGGEIETPLADQPWGDYYGATKDRFGIQWMVNHTPPQDG